MSKNAKRSRKRYASTIYQFQHPDWEPLMGLVGGELARWFMWMGELRLDDGTRVHAYKHVETRRYAHIAVDGRAFEYLAPASLGSEVPERYRECSRVDALDEAFFEWSVFHDGDGDFEAQLRLLEEVREVAQVAGVMPIDAACVARQRRFDAAIAAAKVHELTNDPGFREVRLGDDGDDYVGADASVDGLLDQLEARLAS